MRRKRRPRWKPKIESALLRGAGREGDRDALPSKRIKGKEKKRNWAIFKRAVSGQPPVPPWAAAAGRMRARCASPWGKDADASPEMLSCYTCLGPCTCYSCFYFDWALLKQQYSFTKPAFVLKLAGAAAVFLHGVQSKYSSRLHELLLLIPACFVLDLWMRMPYVSEGLGLPLLPLKTAPVVRVSHTITKDALTSHKCRCIWAPCNHSLWYFALLLCVTPCMCARIRCITLLWPLSLRPVQSCHLHLDTIQQINKDTSIMLEATCMGMCVCVCVFGLKTWTVMWSHWRRGQKAPVPLTFLPLAPCCAFRLWPRTLVYWASSVYKLSLSSSWIINNLSICLYTPTPPHLTSPPNHMLCCSL